MTLFFAVTTTCCLIVIAVFAAATDAAARNRVDTGLLTQARQVSVGIDVDTNGFQFGAPDGDSSESGLTAIGSAPTGFIDIRGIEYASPSDRALPDAAVIDSLFAETTRNGKPAYVTAPNLDGQPRRWVARPVGTSGTGIVLIGTANTTWLTRMQVSAWLIAGVLSLAALSTVVGHLVSGRVMRPAVREVEQQEQFLREAAHELRTPLTTLSLLAESGARQPATAPDTLEEIHERLQKMSRLVSNLLLRAQADLDPGAIPLRPLRLDQLVDVATTELDDNHRIRLQLTATTVRGDAELLTQAVRNLVENALRYAPTGAIHVKVHGGAVIVSDSGPGFSPRGTSVAREHSTGSGLSIVRWIAGLHHATLSIDDTLPAGATVTITFPATS